MATIANQYDPDEKEDTNTGGGGDVMQTGGGGTSDDTSGGGAPQSRATPSGTPNVQQYLAANQGAGEQLTQGITQNVQNQADKVNQGVNSAQNELNTQIDPLQKSLAGGQQVANTAFKDPQKLLNDYNAAKTQSSSQPLSQDQQQGADQYNQFQKLNTGGYNQDIQNLGNAAQQQYGQVQNQFQNFNQNVPSATTEAGRFQLLQNAVGQPNYNQGQQTLDALFLQGQPGGAKQLQQNIGDIRQQTGQSINDVNANVTNKLQALQGLSGQNQDYIKNLFNKGMGDISGNVNQEYTAAQNNAANIQGNLARDLKTGNLTPEELGQLGLAQGQQTWGVDLTNAGHYTANPLAAANQGGLAQVASPEEFARYNALNQLAGGPAGTAQSSIFGTSQNAGGYQPYSYDRNALNQAISDKQKGLDADFKAAMQQSLAGFNFSDSGGGAPGSFRSANNGVGVPYAQQLMSQLKGGTLTPEQANQQILQMNQELMNKYGAPNPEFYKNQWMDSYQPFLNFYNSKYSPAAAARIGQTSPDATPLPTKDNGQIDWGSLPAPTGGAGKGGTPKPPPPGYYLPDKT